MNMAYHKTELRLVLWSRTLEILNKRITLYNCCKGRYRYKKELDAVKIGYEDGYESKDEYANCLRAYQKWHDETKSDMRDKARAILT